MGVKLESPSEKPSGAQYVFGLPKKVLAAFISISILGLYLLPPDCSVPNIMFRVNENQNLTEDIFYLPGSTAKISKPGQVLVSAIDIQEYLVSKDAAIQKELECKFDKPLGSGIYTSCYQIFNIPAGQTLLSGTVRKENCQYISNFILSLDTQP